VIHNTIFSYRPTINCTVSPQATIAELADFVEFTKLAEKFFLPLRPTPIYKLSMISVVWNISTGQPGLAAWLCSLPAPAHLLFSQTWETEKRSLIS